MSVRAMSVVWRVDLPAATKLLLLTLADHGDDHGSNVYPSIATMSQMTSMPERTVQRHLAKLRQAGILIEVEPPAHNWPTRYRINLPELEEMPQRVKPGPRSCPPALRREVIEAFGSRCVYCKRLGDGDTDPDGRRFHVDRIVPGSQGGTYERENVTLACAACNTSKNAAPAAEDVESLADRTGDAKMTPLRGVPDRARGVPDQPLEGCQNEHGGVPSDAPDPIDRSVRLIHTPTPRAREADLDQVERNRREIVDVWGRLSTRPTIDRNTDEQIEKWAAVLHAYDVERITDELDRHTAANPDDPAGWPLARSIFDRYYLTRRAGGDPARGGGRRPAVRGGDRAGARARGPRGDGRSAGPPLREADELDPDEAARIIRDSGLGRRDD